MRNFIYFFFILLFIQTSYADNNDLVTELKIFDESVAYRHLYYYNQDEKKVLETKYISANEDNSSWKCFAQTEWIYQNGNCVIQQEKEIASNVTTVVHKIESEYNNDVLLSEIYSGVENGSMQQYKKIEFEYQNSLLSTKKEYSVVANTPTLYREENYFYNSNQTTDSMICKLYMLETEKELYNVTDRYKISFSYDESGRIQTQLFQEKNNEDSEWTPLTETKWYYLPDSDNISSIRTKKWNASTLQWEYIQMLTYEYNENGKLVAETFSQWNILFWKESTRYCYEYNNDVLEKISLLSPLYNEWRNIQTTYYTDFTNKKASTIESKSDFWGGITGEPVNTYLSFVFNDETVIKKAEKVQLSYLQITDITTPNDENKLEVIQVYPNPSEGFFYINNANLEVQSWAVYDLNGSLLKQDVLNFRTGVVNITDLKSGIYMLKVKTTENNILTQKLIKK